MIYGSCVVKGILEPPQPGPVKGSAGRPRRVRPTASLRPAPGYAVPTISRLPNASALPMIPKAAISVSGGGSQDQRQLGFQPHVRFKSAAYSARFRAAIDGSITGTPSACARRSWKPISRVEPRMSVSA